jgi:hypothetical protein
MGLKAGWLAMMLFVWMVGAFLGSTFEYHVDDTTGTAEQIAAAGAQAGKWAGSSTGGYDESPATTLDYILNVTNSFQRVPFFNITIPIPTNSQYWDSIYKVITWRWSFMEDYTMIWWLFCAPFVAMGIFSFIMIAYGIVTGNLSWS